MKRFYDNSNGNAAAPSDATIEMQVDGSCAPPMKKAVLQYPTNQFINSIMDTFDDMNLGEEMPVAYKNTTFRKENKMELDDLSIKWPEQSTLERRKLSPLKSPLAVVNKNVRYTPSLYTLVEDVEDTVHDEPDSDMKKVAIKKKYDGASCSEQPAKKIRKSLFSSCDQNVLPLGEMEVEMAPAPKLDTSSKSDMSSDFHGFPSSTMKESEYAIDLDLLLDMVVCTNDMLQWEMTHHRDG